MGRRMRLATVEDTEGLGQHIRQHSGGVAIGHGAWILVSGPAMIIIIILVTEINVHSFLAKVI